MASTPFDELAGHHCALLDTSSINLLASEVVAYFLTTRPHDIQINRQPWERQQRVPELRDALDILARMLVYDFVAVDRQTLSALYIDDIVSEALVRTTEVPVATYNEAARAMDPAVHKLQRTGNKFWMKKPGWGEPSLNRHHERLAKLAPEGGLDLPEWATDPEQTLARRLLHFQVAQQAKVPLFLSPSKQDWFPLLSGHLRPETFRLVEKGLAEDQREGVREAINRIYNAGLGFDLPPLTECILRLSERRKSPPLETALSIHRMAAARAFRAALRRMLEAVLAQGVAGYVRAEAARSDLAAACEAWQAELGRELGEPCPQATAAIASLPTLEWLHGLLTAAPLTADAPQLANAPLYVTVTIHW